MSALPDPFAPTEDLEGAPCHDRQRESSGPQAALTSSAARRKRGANSRSRLDLAAHSHLGNESMAIDQRITALEAQLASRTLELVNAAHELQSARATEPEALLSSISMVLQLASLVVSPARADFQPQTSPSLDLRPSSSAHQDAPLPSPSPPRVNTNPRALLTPSSTTSRTSSWQGSYTPQTSWSLETLSADMQTRHQDRYATSPETPPSSNKDPRPLSPLSWMSTDCRTTDSPSSPGAPAHGT